MPNIQENTYFIMIFYKDQPNFFSLHGTASLPVDHRLHHVTPRLPVMYLWKPEVLHISEVCETLKQLVP